MRSTNIRVVKVGGSLFSWDQLSSTIRNWLVRQTPMHTVLLAGGGGFAEVVRSADERLGLGQEASNWICIDLLRATSRLLASLLQEAELVRQWTELTDRLQAHSKPGLIIFDPVQFLYEIEPSAPGDKLPGTWDATSDSIAARVAANLKSDELVLLKSMTPASASTLDSLARQGIVDRFFPRASKSVRSIRVVNLREPGFEEAAFHSS